MKSVTLTQPSTRIKMKTHLLLPVFATLTFFGSSMIRAEDTTDDKFMKKAALHGKAEVNISELGVKKADNDGVKSIAQETVKDHTQFNKELEELAQSKHLALSSASDPDTDKIIAKLEKESGSGFDKAFLKVLEKGHKDSVSAFEDAQKNCTDPNLKEWVNKSLPTIKGHLDNISKALESR